MPRNAGCPPAGRRSWARRPRQSRDRICVHPDPALLVRRDDRGRAEAEIAQRHHERFVPFGSGQHSDARRAGQPADQVIPSDSVQQVVPGGSEAGEIGHRRARREADIAARRQAQQVEQPGSGHLLDGGCTRCRDAHAGVLIPGAGQPVRGECRRERAADDPAVRSGRTGWRAARARRHPRGCPPPHPGRPDLPGATPPDGRVSRRRQPETAPADRATW